MKPTITLLASLLLIPVAVLHAAASPNIIVILSDDLGYADLGCFRSKAIKTPHLGRMVEEGLKLTSFYAQPVCGPSRAALMTGCFPMRVAEPGNRKNQHNVLHPREVTMAEMLKDAGYANEMRTWWQPVEGDTQPTLTSTFGAPATIHAVRLTWRDIGLDTKRDVKPGSFRYRVELETAKDEWTTILDRSESIEDLLIDYRECKPNTGTRARLVILASPKGNTPGVAEFTVLGKTVVTK